jgi:hypothetical protein
VEAIYFKREGCPHCRREDPEVESLLRERPSLKLRVLAPGVEEGLWKTYGVEVVPTVLFRRADGQAAIARGFATRDELLRSLATLEGGTK